MTQYQVLQQMGLVGLSTQKTSRVKLPNPKLKGVLTKNFMAEITCEIDSREHVYLQNINSEYSLEGALHEF